jgi:hypothetical protein
MKSPKIFFPTTTEIEMMEMFIDALVWTTQDNPPLHVPLSFLLDYGIFLSLLPLKTIRIVAYGLLLQKICLNMTIFLAK